MSITITENISKEAAKDIFELQQKINAYLNGNIPEDKFKHFRLTRGVYGQRQMGVQMFRIKLPAGRITPAQLIRVANLSEQYASGNLHLTTRQDIQLHFVRVIHAPAIWAGLEDAGITAREACGNTVRNITASPTAGIDADEPFDVAPYAWAAFRYFLRNPVCQDMGRKVKIAFSSSENDSAYTFLHDFGFIPRLREGMRGFKVVVGGGLGAQAMLAQTAFEFLPEDQVIPFLEAGLRVFDRYGERSRRNKARLKFLIKEMGLEAFLELVNKERKALRSKSFQVDTSVVNAGTPPLEKPVPPVLIADRQHYEDWLKTNVREQKQAGFFSVRLKIPNGDIKAPQARKIAALAADYASEDMRVTMNQGLMLKFVRPEALPYVYSVLHELGFAEPGFDTIADITTCPGTDTCNLGVTNSMTLARILEGVVQDEFRHLIFDSEIKIKMSGCMNSCGQHMAAQIGLHGSSIKVGELVAPAMQVVLGGGVDQNGVGTIGDKIVKLPTKRMPDALRMILNDYEINAFEGEYFNDYYRRQGKHYFYTMLKPLADTKTFKEEEFYDYGHEELFTPEVGVGECAGVMYDMVGTILKEASEKLEEARQSLYDNQYPEAIYYAYTGYIIAAKAILLSKDIECNTQIKILKDFDTHLAGELEGIGSLEARVLSLQEHEPDAGFARKYVDEFSEFLEKVVQYRTGTIQGDKIVAESAYKA